MAADPEFAFFEVEVRVVRRRVFRTRTDLRRRRTAKRLGEGLEGSAPSAQTVRRRHPPGKSSFAAASTRLARGCPDTRAEAESPKLGAFQGWTVRNLFGCGPVALRSTVRTPVRLDDETDVASAVAWTADQAVRFLTVLVQRLRNAG